MEGLVGKGREGFFDVGVDALGLLLGVFGGVRVAIVLIEKVVKLRGPGQNLEARFGVVNQIIS